MVLSWHACTISATVTPLSPTIGSANRPRLCTPTPRLTSPIAISRCVADINYDDLTFGLFDYVVDEVRVGRCDHHPYACMTYRRTDEWKMLKSEMPLSSRS
jgi:hypothetical protein